MVSARKGDIGDSEGVSKQPRSLEIGQRGVRSAEDFASLMSALMTDVLEGSVTPNVANTVCNAGARLLKVVEMQLKYSPNQLESRRGKLMLLPPEE